MAAELPFINYSKDGLVGFEFILGSQTSGTNIKLLRFPINQDSRRMNVRPELTISMLLGVADVLTKNRFFTADFAFQDWLSLQMNIKDCKLPYNNIPYFYRIFKRKVRVKVSILN
jgi:hypothetical protein